MIKPNGRQKKALEGLAAALNECFEAATERATEAAERAQNAAERAQNAAERAQNAAERAEQAVREVGPRLDRQDATLRMIWTQCGGKEDQRLPIDRD